MLVIVGGKQPYIEGTQGGACTPLTVAPVTVIVPAAVPPQSVNEIVWPEAITCQTAIVEETEPEKLTPLEAVIVPVTTGMPVSPTVHELPDVVIVFTAPMLVKPPESVTTQGAQAPP